jgi:predicted GTPase
VSDATFAVVGHPNKGKSSLVAALAQDESVGIGPEPGTTVRARHFPMRVDGQTLYVLVDTPGFQRPRAVLEWLQAQRVSAAERPSAIARFVAEHAGDERFAAERELLAPLVAGAGILYVVDGAVPYTPEYDAEMEILRWTGRPSVAVINPIGGAGHVQDWSRALSQYFRVVRVLDALDAPLEKRLQVLSAFGELAEEWREPMATAITALRAEREHAREEAARAIRRSSSRWSAG